MADPNRSISRWSGITRSTVETSQTAPIVAVRRKLLRQPNISPRVLLQQNNRSKHDIEQLFKLYYSNDLQFDGFQKQIVTGKRIHTVRPVLSKTRPLQDSSIDYSHRKLYVSREENSRNESEKRDITPKLNQTLPVENSRKNEPESTLWHRIPTAPIVRVVSAKSEATTVNPEIPPTSITTSTDDFCEPSIVKSVSFFGENLPPELVENDDFDNQKIVASQSSLHSLTTKTPQTSTNSIHPVKYPGPLPKSTNPSVKYQIQGSMRTTTAISARYRTASKKYYETNARVKSGASRTTSSSAKTITFAPSLRSATPKTSDTDFEQTDEIDEDNSSTSPRHRIVSIPARCSRYVLVSFPEVPLRYNAPSYVERLLLPERFPKMFHNIVRSYENRSRSAPNKHALK